MDSQSIPSRWALILSSVCHSVDHLKRSLKEQPGQGLMSGDMTEPFQFLPLECSKQRLLGTHQTGDDTSDKFVRPLLFVGDRTVC